MNKVSACKYLLVLVEHLRCRCNNLYSQTSYCFQKNHSEWYHCSHHFHAGQIPHCMRWPNHHRILFPHLYLNGYWTSAIWLFEQPYLASHLRKIRTWRQHYIWVKKKYNQKLVKLSWVFVIQPVWIICLRDMSDEIVDLKEKLRKSEITVAHSEKDDTKINFYSGLCYINCCVCCCSTCLSFTWECEQ